MMDYQEFTPPSSLAALVKGAWTLRIADAEQVGTIAHQAMPDGCVEIIERSAGESFWRRPQPAQFVAGMIDQPAELLFSAQAAFRGLRLWPWTWFLLAGRHPTQFRNDWIEAEQSGLQINVDALLAGPCRGNWQGLADLLRNCCSETDEQIAAAALACESTTAMATTTGLSTRACQRWFERHVGLPPRHFRRLLRFEQGLRGLDQSGKASLADQASAAGYADQAHMAREFRHFSKSSASALRRRLRGPFA